MPLQFTQARIVAVGDPVGAGDMASLAQAVNTRLVSGIGDFHYRVAFYLHSLFRKMRNDEGTLSTPEAEFWTFYQALEANDGEWPTAEPGEPTGANLANPMNQFVFGSEALDLDGERGRLGNVNTILGLPPGQEATAADYWQLGKDQRGAYDPSNGNDSSPMLGLGYSYAYIRSSLTSRYGNSYGGYFPTPTDAGGCTPIDDGDGGTYNVPVIKQAGLLDDQDVDAGQGSQVLIGQAHQVAVADHPERCVAVVAPRADVVRLCALAAAGAAMEQRHVKQLPVVEGDKYLGMVEEDDLMDEDPDTQIVDLVGSLIGTAVRGNDYFLVAVKASYLYDLDLVPVSNERQEYEGAVTRETLFRQLARITGSDEYGSLLVLEMERNDYAPGLFNRLVESNDALITQMNSWADPANSLMTVVIRINKEEISDIVASFQRHGFVVRYYLGEELFRNELQSNLDHLMNYLNM
jgi:CBS domain-containing protein